MDGNVEQPKRDYVLARVGIAIMRVTEASELLHMAMGVFADPEEDEGAPDRVENLDNALLSCHEAATAIGLAKDMMEHFSDADSAFSEDSLDEDDSAP